MNRGQPQVAEYAAVRRHFEQGGVFQDYEALWSLADKKYAGTLTLVHKRVTLDKERIAFTIQSAIDLLLKRYRLTREQVGLSKSPETTKKQQQTSMKSFFEVKASNGTTKSVQDHHEEGRFQFLQFVDLDLIQTYVPNNGLTRESNARRRAWDEEMHEFLLARLKILAKAKQSGRRLLWCGDLNVARDYRDGTHWERSEGTVTEYWTNEKRCLTNNKADPKRSPQDRGIPGFTANERIRFNQMIVEANLVDVWRELHPNGVKKVKTTTTQCDQPNYTWRGTLGSYGNHAKYQGKGQRLDYFLMSPATKVMDDVDSCQILGYGEKREGLFCGSDHCVSLLKLKN
jgi:exonuclease III